MNNDGIAWLECKVLFPECAPHVIYRDLIVVTEHVDALEVGNVDQRAARDKGRNVLHSKLGEAGTRGDLLGLEAVVVTVSMCLMGEAVELGADLSDLRQHHLLIAAALV